MSAIAETARVSILLADFALVDTAQKVNILGAGWQITGINPQTGATAAQTVVVMVDVAPEHVGDEYAFEVALYDPNDAVVSVPGPTGELTPLRIARNMTAERPTFPGNALPKDAIWSHSQAVLNFPTGLALTPGGVYTWKVRIDNDVEHEWAASFYVVGPPPPVVFG